MTMTQHKSQLTPLNLSDDTRFRDGGNTATRPLHQLVNMQMNESTSAATEMAIVERTTRRAEQPRSNRSFPELRSRQNGLNRHDSMAAPRCGPLAARRRMRCNLPLSPFFRRIQPDLADFQLIFNLIE